MGYFIFKCYINTDAKFTDKKKEEEQTFPPKDYVPYKAKIRKAGTGCISKINDNLYEGRYTPTIDGKRKPMNIYAHSEEECEEKLAELIRDVKAQRDQAHNRKSMGLMMV